MADSWEEMRKLLGGPFAGPKPTPKPEKGVRLHAKEIDGVRYILATDVADLLKINGVLPKAEKLLRRTPPKRG